MPYSETAWLDYLGLESKVSGLCLMNISINHPGCLWNNYLAEPTVAGKALGSGHRAGFIRSPAVILAIIIICLQLHSWLVIYNRWLFIPCGGCFSRYLTFLWCHSPGVLTPASEAYNKAGQRCKVSHGCRCIW